MILARTKVSRSESDTCSGFQERGCADCRGCEVTAASVPDRSLTVMHPDQRALSGSDQIVPTVPGPHERRGTRCQGWHRGVPVAVQAQTVELFNGARQLSVRAHAEDR